MPRPELPLVLVLEQVLQPELAPARLLVLARVQPPQQVRVQPLEQVRPRLLAQRPDSFL
ncbi:hypothetical protein [Rhodosalinus sediminis]|uniref:hypothetical protein n=1 Tax=Rhodosalinus sediminis TaxID=1940533 RepID=UPI00235357B2|nr:hypothetical protein [Rhodosalinus sediminis]